MGLRFLFVCFDLHNINITHYNILAVIFLPGSFEEFK